MARRSGLDDSLILRSAESLGRMIGALQRQLDAAAARTPVNGSRQATATNNHPGVAKRAAATETRTAAAPRAKVATKRKAATRKATKRVAAKQTAKAKRRG